MWKAPNRPNHEVTQSYNDGVVLRREAEPGGDPTGDPVQYRPGVSSQDVAVTQDGRQYRIDLVQRVQDVFPPSMYEVIP